MARHEADREDLFAEAKALSPRVELFRDPASDEPIVLGIREAGGMSVYFGPDPVYHFDVEGRLKRAYRDGRLFRTQGSTLAELTRERTDQATVLRRRDLSPAERDAFLAAMQQELRELVSEIERGEVRIARSTSVAPGRDPLDTIAESLRRTCDGREPALAPAYKGKR